MTNDDRVSLWQQRLAKQKASGLSVTAWCKQQNLCRRHFYSWRKRLAKNSVPLPSTSPQWLAVTKSSS